MDFFSRRPLTSFFFLIALFAGGGGEAYAATILWTGNSTNAFATGGNWSGTNTPPINGDSLTFGAAGTSGLMLNNNLTSGSFNVAGITFNLGAGAFVIGNGTTTANVGNTFTLTGNVTNNSTSLQTINNPILLSGTRTFTTKGGGGNITLGGTLDGPGGGIAVAGGGTLTLTGTNSYSGGTSVANGATLQLGNGGASGSVSSSALNPINNSGTLIFNRSDDFTFTGVISGSGGVTVNSGVVRLDVAQTYTGPTQITNAALVLASAPAKIDPLVSGLSASTVVTLGTNGRLDLANHKHEIAGLSSASGVGRVYSFVSGGGSAGGLTVNIPAAQTYTYSGTLGDSDPGFSFTKKGEGTQILATNANYTGSTTISEGTLQLGNGGATGSVLSSTSNPINNNGTLAFNRSDDYNFTGKIVGSGGVVMNGNILRFTTAQEYAGPTEINNSGILVLPTPAMLSPASTPALPVTTVVSIGPAAKLDLSNRVQPISGLTGSGTLYSFGGSSGILTLAPGPGLSFTFSGVLGPASDSFAFSIDKSGTGTQILSGTNSYTGTTTISGGTLQSARNASLGSTSAISVVNAGSTLAINYGGASDYNEAQATALLAKTTFGASTTVFAFDTTNASGAVTYSQALAMAGGLTKLGPGTLVLTGANTYGGATTISAGTLQVGTGGATSALPAGTAITNNGTLVFNLSGVIASSGAISGSGSVVQQGSGTLTLSGTNTYSGATTISAGTLSLSGALSGGGAIIISGSGGLQEISTGVIGGASSLTLNGSGTTVLAGANTYTGATTINGGTLRSTRRAALASTIAISVNNAGSTLVVNYGGASDYTETQVAALLAKTTFGAASTVFALDTTNASGPVTYGNLLAMNAGLTKLGPGTLVLTGSNAYTGATLIGAGTLQVGNGGTTGSLSPSSAITNNGTLAFNRSDTITQGVDFASAISGSGQIVQQGSGTLILNRDFTSGATVNAGVLQVGDGAHAVLLRGGGGAPGITGGNGAGVPGGPGGSGITLNNGSSLNILGLAAVVGGRGGSGSHPFDDTRSTGGAGGPGGTAVVLSSNSVFTLSANAAIIGGNGGDGGDGAFYHLNQGGGQDGGGPGGLGGVAIVFLGVGPFTNHGIITGGSGGAGGVGGGGGFGGVGGAGLIIGPGGSLINYGPISGGAGGTGGGGNVARPGGAGNTGLIMGAGGSLINYGPISGGAGGTGGTGNSGGTGGAGAVGMTIGEDGSLINHGSISGGSGGTGGAGYVPDRGGDGGTGLIISAGGSLINYGLISGGRGGATGAGDFYFTPSSDGVGVVFTGSGSTLINQSGGIIDRGVVFHTSAASVTLETGSTINGVLVLGADPSTTLTLSGSGTQVYSGAVTGATTFAGSLIKSGTGTWTLDQAFTYTGATMVNAGTLQLTSTLGNTAVTVASGATLSGTGTIGSSGSLTFDSGAFLSVDPAGALSVGGNLMLNGTISILLNAAPSSVGNGQTIRLLNYSGTLTGSLTSLSTAGFRHGTVSTTPGSPNQINLTFDTAPITWFGNSSAWDLVTTANWGNAGTEKFFQGDAVFFGDTGSTKAVVVNTVVCPSGVTFTNSAGNDYTLSGNGSIQQGAGITQSGTGSVAINVPIAGAGTLVKSGTGTLTLSALNSYTGATTISAGTLALTGSLSGTAISTSGSGIISETAAGTIGGAASLTIGGSGTSVLAGTNTYTGPTVINTGTLQLGNGGTTGSLSPSSAITNNGSLVFNRSNTVTQGTDFGAISGSGSVVLQGGGTVIFTGTNTYSGNTIVSAGTTLQVGTGGGSGSLSGNITDNGTVFFKRGGDYTYPGVLSGSGGVTYEGDILRFSQAQSYTGPTQINSGILVLPQTGTLPSNFSALSPSTVVTVRSPGALDIGNRAQTIAGLSDAGGAGGTVYGFGGGGILTLNVASGQSYTFSGTIGGASPNFGVTKGGLGTQVLSGTNNYSGATVISAGTLQVGDGGTTGKLPQSSAITDNGMLAFNRSNTVTQGIDFANTIAGSGQVVQEGTGTLILRGTNNAFKGGAVVNHGTLQVGDGSTTVLKSGIIAGGSLGANGANGSPGGAGGVGSSSMTVIVVNSSTLNLVAQASIVPDFDGPGGRGGTGGSGNATFKNGSTGGIGGVGGNGGNAIVANGSSFVNLAAQATVTAGNGGTGGTGGFGGDSFNNLGTAGDGGRGGPGGAGGNGIVVNGGSTLTLAAQGVITAGQGGTGGVGGAAGDSNGGTNGVSGAGGNGGDGGSGVIVGTGGSFTNGGTISAGNAGNGGAGNSIGLSGNGGTGVVFSAGGSLTNSGTISAGLAGFGGSAGLGVSFSGAAGTLSNQSGGVINGGVSFGNFANSVTLETGSTINGALNIGPSFSAALTLTGSGSQVYSGAVTGGTTFAGSLTKSGSGTWTLDQPWSYTGPTQIDAGRLALGADQALSNSTVVTVAAAATLDLFGHAQTVAGLEGSGTVHNSSATANTFTLGIASGQTHSFAGNLGGASPSFGFTKTGPGTQVLSGTNNYTGASTVSEGTLVVNGSIAASPSVVVESGATLSGRGRVSALSGAGLVAPDGPGILTGTKVDPSGGLDFTFKLSLAGAPTYADAAASGNALLRLTDAAPFVLALTADNVITLDLSGDVLVEGQTFLGGFFLDAPGSDAAALDALLSNATFVYTGLFGIVEYDGLVTVPSADFATGTVTNGKVMEFKVIAIPEPGSAGLALLGGFVLLSRPRRAGGRKNC